MGTGAGAEPMLESRMKRDLVFVGRLYSRRGVAKGIGGPICIAYSRRVISIVGIRGIVYSQRVIAIGIGGPVWMIPSITGCNKRQKTNSENQMGNKISQHYCTSFATTKSILTYILASFKPLLCCIPLFHNQGRQAEISLDLDRNYR